MAVTRDLLVGIGCAFLIGVAVGVEYMSAADSTQPRKVASPEWERRQSAPMIVDYSALRTKAFISCMNGGGWAWRDPHTDEQVAVFCDRHVISRPM